MTTAKQKITALVKDYSTLFPGEFDNFKKSLKQKVSGQKDKYASISEDSTIERALFEIPETLDYLFVTKLESEELKWFYTKEGGRWFVKNFKDFRLTHNA